MEFFLAIENQTPVIIPRFILKLYSIAGAILHNSEYGLVLLATDPSSAVPAMPEKEVEEA